MTGNLTLFKSSSTADFPYLEFTDYTGSKIKRIDYGTGTGSISLPNTSGTILVNTNFSTFGTPSVYQDRIRNATLKYLNIGSMTFVYCVFYAPAQISRGLSVATGFPVPNFNANAPIIGIKDPGTFGYNFFIQKSTGNLVAADMTDIPVGWYILSGMYINCL